MKVVYTAEGLRDLDEILAFIESNYPMIAAPFARRLRTIERRIGQWPESAEEVAQRPGVRVVPFIRYPFKSSIAFRMNRWKSYISIIRRGRTRG